MKMTIAVLEDNAERTALMEDCLADKFPFYARRFFRSAPEAIEWLHEHLQETICVSLDHDLERPLDQPDAKEPGTGREVADYLAQQAACCPIVVHTTNVPAAMGMELELEDAGWQVARITPYGDLEWVTELWLPTLRQAIVETAVPPQRGGASSIARSE